ncbi:hypothetical protein [Ralstonia soli]|uniref:Uncharacterized protein n=1 Tax=Ralstonia soli TaxID=2953896 RepID=A0ABT1AQK4_9RALS|nr:hypothetical protein [Ralstonia soli]MCO5400747.1 hypothetical protein [Ralstonia soli]
MSAQSTQSEGLQGVAGIGPISPIGDTSQRPLSVLLAAIGPYELAHHRDRLATQHRHKLVQAYQRAMATGKRELAFLLSEALTARRAPLPPCFRLDDAHRVADMAFDLLAHDLQWIRTMYPEQWRKASGSYASLLHGEGDSWLPRAEYLWTTKHQAKTWILVRQMALTVDQQWECNVLRSQPVRHAAQGLRYRRVKTHKAIMAQLPEAKRRQGEGEATHTLERRYRIWLCGEMTGRSPTKTARLYGLWQDIDMRTSTAARDLDWVFYNVSESRGSRSAKTSKFEMPWDMQ